MRDVALSLCPASGVVRAAPSVKAAHGWRICRWRALLLTSRMLQGRAIPAVPSTGATAGTRQGIHSKAFMGGHDFDAGDWLALRSQAQRSCAGKNCGLFANAAAVSLFRVLRCCKHVCANLSRFFCGRPPFADPKVWFYRDGYSEAQ